MKNYQFVMITKWLNHWGRLNNGRTCFSKNLIVFNEALENIKENVETLFIKQGEHDSLEKKLGRQLN